MESRVGLTEALLAGGIAGTVVDALLFPIDTLKTRLQSSQGFWAAGGFRNVYSGLSAAMLGSAPNAAAFFGTYELTKSFLFHGGYMSPVSSQMTAGAIGAIASCIARVPADNVKQKVQAGRHASTIETLRAINRTQGMSGFFIGFRATVLREMPFSVIQFTVWEDLKRRLRKYHQRKLNAWESGLCGSVAGALAAALTTPIDVLKTRQMIGEAPKLKSTRKALVNIFHREGISGLFSGFLPRIQLCFFGGLIFFSAYDASLSFIHNALFVTPSDQNYRNSEDSSAAPQNVLGDTATKNSQALCKHRHQTTVSEALFAGGIAGICVDTVLFPLDTLKTRLQSSQGFQKAGGFKGVYRGIGAAVIGSAPIASLFFGAYEFTKHTLEHRMGVAEGEGGWVVPMVAGIVGETVACFMVVPTENIKQKVQAGLHPTAIKSLLSILEEEGPRGLYRGYSATVLREVPFSIIQYPIWEALKHQLIISRNDCSLASWESGLCGAAAGAIAATLTTPLDVAKTRLMLRSSDRMGVQYSGTFETMRSILRQDGVLALFSGLGPRVHFNVLGGLVFFSAYERALMLLRDTTGSSCSE